MDRLIKLYQKAQRSPNNLSYSEECALAEGVGFEHKHGKGDHRFYRHNKVKEVDCMLNFQNRHGKAVPYQVKQLLILIDKYGLLERRDGDA